MPSMKRKRKSKTDLERWADIPASVKPFKAAKVSPFQVMTQKEEADPSSDFRDDVSATLSEYDAIMARVDRNPAQLMTECSLPPDPIATERTVYVGSLPLSSLADLETIFSPNFETDDPQLNPVNDINGANIESDLPCLIGDESDDGTCFTTDFQTFSLLDFCSFESDADSSFNISMGFSDVFITGSPPIGLVSSDMITDMTEKMLPFFERPAKTGDDQNTMQEIMYSNACSFSEIQEPDIWCLSEEMDHIDPHFIARTLSDLPEAVTSIWPLILPNETQQMKPVTLVLDLDETLVHSTLDHCEDADFTFPVLFDAKYHTVYVRRRPHLQTFLENVAQWFEIVIFTASQSIYASKLLDILDPEGKIISKRIYRESCIFSDGSYTKDLRILELDLAKVAIIDNSPQVFRLQVNNGIPIKSWFDDPTDLALLQLLPFLETLVDADDVRPIIAEKFSKIK